MSIEVVQVPTIPSLGTLLGTAIPNNIINSINLSLGKTSNQFKKISNVVEKGRNEFFNKIIKPLKAVKSKFDKLDFRSNQMKKFKLIESTEDLLNIPLSMHMPILLFKPIRNLLEQGRINGYGYNPEFLPKEDYYDRLINNGKVKDLSSSLKKIDNKYYTEFKWIFKSEDPDLSDEDLDIIHQTRKYLKELLETSKIDPTSPLELRG